MNIRLEDIEKKQSKLPSVFLYKVCGNSMEPTIYNEDAILVERKLKDRLRIGDIVLYGTGIFTVHRIIWRSKGFFVTKGDKASGCAWVKKIDIVGKVRYIYRKNKEMRCSSLSRDMYFVIRGLIVTLVNRVVSKIT